MDDKKKHYPILDGLKSVFNKSLSKDISENYLKKFSNVTKWLCLSDYSLGGKTNDVMTFSFVPYVIDFEDLANFIKNISPSEIKNARKINPAFITFLKSGLVLNVSIILENHKYLFAQNNDSLQKLLRSDIERLIYEDINRWNLLRPHMVEENEKIRQKAKAVLRLVDHRKKLTIIKNLYLTTIFGGYLSSFIANETKAEIFGWFSDRDEINDVADHFSMNMFSIVFYEYLLGENCQFVAANALSTADEWYKDLIKIPDYLTGTIADYDFATKMVSKEKFSAMLIDFYADNINNAFLLKLKFNENGSTVFSRMTFHKESKSD